MKNIKVEIHEGVGKKSEKPYKCLKVTVGKWSKLIFPDSSFEMDYLYEYLNKEDGNILED